MGLGKQYQISLVNQISIHRALCASRDGSALRHIAIVLYQSFCILSVIHAELAKLALSGINS